MQGIVLIICSHSISAGTYCAPSRSLCCCTARKRSKEVPCTKAVLLLCRQAGRFVLDGCQLTKDECECVRFSLLVLDYDCDRRKNIEFLCIANLKLNLYNSIKYYVLQGVKNAYQIYGHIDGQSNS